MISKLFVMMVTKYIDTSVNLLPNNEKFFLFLGTFVFTFNTYGEYALLKPSATWKLRHKGKF